MTDVSNGAPSNIIGIRDVLDAVNRLEGKMDSRLDVLDAKVDQVSSRQDRIEGVLSVVKWLGPVGVVALVYGIGKASGMW
jgi:hypothetical protein